MKDEYEEFQDVAVLQINDWQGFIKQKQLKEIRFCFALGQKCAFAVMRNNIVFQIKWKQAIHIFDEEYSNYRYDGIQEYEDNHGCRIEVVPIRA